MKKKEEEEEEDYQDCYYCTQNQHVVPTTFMVCVPSIPSF